MFIETPTEFSERHGCECVTLGNRSLYANGAQAINGVGIDPPKGKWELLKLKQEFHTKKLETLEGRFHQYKTDCEEQTRFHRIGNSPPPDEADVANLQRFKKLVESERINLKVITWQLSQSPEELAKQAIAQQPDLREKRAAELTQACRSINI